MNNNSHPSKIDSKPTGSEKTDHKKSVIKATLLGLACGVMFILAAKFVSLVIN